MVRIPEVRIASWGLAVAAMLAMSVVTGAWAQKGPAVGDGPTPTIQIAASEGTSRFVPLGIGKSVVIDLPRDVKDVLVADPKIANAVVRTSRRARWTRPSASCRRVERRSSSARGSKGRPPG